VCNVMDATHKRRRIELADVDPNEPVEMLMVLIEVECGMAVADQRVTHVQRHGHGDVERLLLPHRSLCEQGARTDPTEVTIYHRTAYAARQLLPPDAAGSGGAHRNGTEQPAALPSSHHPATDEDAARLIAQLFQGNAGGGGTAAPQLQRPQHDAAASPDELIARLFQEPATTAAAAAPALVAVDPDDPEYQKRLYEEIQRQNLLENLTNAMEHTPEAFARVVMLYVPCTVNNVAVTAFVDSGAQMSVMSERMAEKCGILRLLDKRMSGVAKGVGTCKILGRVHMTMVTLGKLVLPFSVTILERQDMDFLIGLDQLKRHQMQIDLKDGCLRIDDTAIPFLSEGELPEHLRKESAGEGAADDGEGVDVARGAGAAPPAALSSADEHHPTASSSAQSPSPIPSSQTTSPHLSTEIEGKIDRLFEMTNLPRHVIREALDACDGSEDAAALLLLEGGGS
jgi:predicted aspartyl protease